MKFKDLTLKCIMLCIILGLIIGPVWGASGLTVSCVPKKILQGGSTTITVSYSGTGSPYLVLLHNLVVKDPDGFLYHYNESFILKQGESKSVVFPSAYFDYGDTNTLGVYNVTVTYNKTGDGTAWDTFTVTKQLSVGGVEISIDKLGLVAPYIGFGSITMIGAVAAAVCVKRVRRRKEKE